MLPAKGGSASGWRRSLPGPDPERLLIDDALAGASNLRTAFWRLSP